MLDLQVPEHGRYQSQDHDDVVMLDTAAGLWIALNPTAGYLWRSWEAGAGFEAGVAAVAARYPDIPRESIRADAERLARELSSRSLIKASPLRTMGDAATMAEPDVASLGPRPGRLRLLAALLCVVAASVLVRCSFRVSFALVRASRRRWCRRAATLPEAADAVVAVSRAARLYPGRAACLELTLAAVLLAAGRRRRLDWCLGSVPDPYRFHSWVEADGQAVPASAGSWSQSGYARVLAA
jgi:Transglutaminase-like superfamily/Coenzyme PQQ synthesis protein D (PqqD)